ncbi:GntR family transcriptional regulator [Paraglaciecola aquimarina]|uniref:GntR family transcriptional regulator n=1 Tax=Paraglaciecola algarum TaxID=3050085 RepID=A0ABS9D444_9ALTE|nr:GntR family transcriptional regulator [Paraglaciecola sp. G1-23]MCF2947712.1 GntR family transcriptional regulator [Paraglaciecola sp. G1-23]
MQHSSLLLQLSPSSGEPIYRQLIEQIKRMIASGQLNAGDYLPSVRQLAVELEVNPMTISKAYGFLESHGDVSRIRGKGMMIAELAHEENVAARLQKLSPLAEILVQQCQQLGLNKQQTLEWLTHKLEKELK